MTSSVNISANVIFALRGEHMALKDENNKLRGIKMDQTLPSSPALTLANEIFS